MRRPGRYSEQVLDHYARPRNVGVVARADADVTVENPDCGDVLRLSLRFRQGVVAEARFKAFGCVVALAAGSRLTELLTGLAPAMAVRVDAGRVAAALGGLPPGRERCAGLAGKAVAAAMEDYRRRTGDP